MLRMGFLLTCVLQPAYIRKNTFSNQNNNKKASVGLDWLDFKDDKKQKRKHEKANENDPCGVPPGVPK